MHQSENGFKHHIYDVEQRFQNNLKKLSLRYQENLQKVSNSAEGRDSKSGIVTKISSIEELEQKQITLQKRIEELLQENQELKTCALSNRISSTQGDDALPTKFFVKRVKNGKKAVFGPGSKSAVQAKFLSGEIRSADSIIEVHTNGRWVTADEFVRQVN